uniref:Ankyrin repeat domain-containing protein SOWAHC-like n=1 Tax=Eptatretus burgeri TaxID=7764 RepID=A0A8C4QH73_EPTBU
MNREREKKKNEEEERGTIDREWTVNIAVKSLEHSLAFTKEGFKAALKELVSVKHVSGEAYFVLREKFSHLLQKPTEDEHCEIRHSDEEDAACRKVDESTLQQVVEISTAAGNGGNVCAELDQLPESEHDEDILEMECLESDAIDAREGETASLQSSESSKTQTEKDVAEDLGCEMTSTVALDPLEREWLLSSATAHLFDLKRLLSQEPLLAGKKDFISVSTALHWAAKHGKADMVALLTDAGADVNTCSVGYTPLHIAALHGHKDMVQLLQTTFHARQDIRDHSGKFPRQYLKPVTDSMLPSGETPCSQQDVSKVERRAERRSRKLSAIPGLKAGRSSVHAGGGNRASWAGGSPTPNQKGSRAPQRRWGSLENLVEEEGETPTPLQHDKLHRMPSK